MHNCINGLCNQLQAPGIAAAVHQADPGHLSADTNEVAVFAGPASEAQRTVIDLPTGWNPYLTIGEALHLAAQSFTRDVRTLSCCAA